MFNNKDIIGLADDKFIKEADLTELKARKKKKTVTAFITAGISAAACLLIILNLWLFFSPDSGKLDTIKHNKSKYYNVIVALDEWIDSENKSTFPDIWVDSEVEAVPDAPAPETVEGSYEEVTDNQVAGVIEEDLFKRSDKYIYYLDNNLLRVYSIEGEKSEEIYTYEISSPDIYNYNTPHGIYLSDDCKTVTAIFSASYKETVIYSIDVSNSNHIYETACVRISGRYLSSRVINGELFVINSFTVSSDVNFSNEKEFIPSIDTGKGMSCIPPEDIILPETVTSGRYTVISRFDEKSLEKKDCSAFLSYSTDIYVSQSTIYLTQQYINKEDSYVYTRITAVDFSKEHFENAGTVTVKGFVNDQYSLDEHNGVLRVVTTTDNKKGSSASLYCIDLEKDEIIASVENFAPYRETVRSVRFDGVYAYVCTAVQVTDPVFFFDLSDYSNIKYKETAPIEGFSTSLVNFKDGYLLGIGKGEDFCDFKLEIYREASDSVESVCKYELISDVYATQYKAYYINREEGLVGMALSVYNSTTNTADVRYILLKFDGEQFKEVINVVLKDYGSFDYTYYEFCNKVRATQIDGFFYIIAPNCFFVCPLHTNNN